MYLNQKIFLIKSTEEINQKLYELIENAEKKREEKKKYTRLEFNKEITDKKLTLYFAYLFGLRISEALNCLENLYLHLQEKKTSEGLKYYILRSINLKQKRLSEKSIFFYPFDKYESKMWNFIEKNYYVGITKNLNRHKIKRFCNLWLRDKFIGYNKQGQEVIQESYLNPHTLRHLRALVLFERFRNEEIVRKMLGWSDTRMLYYYIRLARSIEESELERKFLSFLSKKKLLKQYKLNP
jgi:integrase